MQYQLKTRQVCLFFVAFVPLLKLFGLPSILAQTSNEDLWLSVLFNTIIDAFTIACILSAIKKTNCSFFKLIENNFGKTVSKIILIVYFIYFMLKAILPVFEQRDYIKLTLYTLKPNLLYFLPFFIVPFYISTKKLRVLGRLSDVLWLITLNGIITLFALSIANADFGAILPVGARGIHAVSLGTLKAFSLFGDCIYLMFFMGEFEYKKKDEIKILLFYLLGALLVIIFFIIFYCVFTSIAFRQRFALTEISKYTTVINNLGRFDYIGIIMILFSNIFAISLPIYFASRLLNKIFNIQKEWIAPIFTVGTQIAIAVLCERFSFSVQFLTTNVFSLFFFALSNLFPILFCKLCKKETNNNYEKS